MHIHHCAPRPTPPGWQPGVAFTSESVELNDPVRRYTFMQGVSIQSLPHGHVAAPGFGLFATRNFAVGETLGEYAGRVFGLDDGHAPSRYIVETDFFIIDSEYCGNEARFINSSKNSGSPPNTRFVYDEEEGGVKVYVVSVRPIHHGAEITARYELP